MKKVDLSDVPFRKSSFSPDAHGCVEVGIQNGVIYVRDSKNQSGAILVFNHTEWDAFLQGVKAGEFELTADHDMNSDNH